LDYAARSCPKQQAGASILQPLSRAALTSRAAINRASSTADLHCPPDLARTFAKQSALRQRASRPRPTNVARTTNAGQEHSAAKTQNATDVPSAALLLIKRLDHIPVLVARFRKRTTVNQRIKAGCSFIQKRELFGSARRHAADHIGNLALASANATVVLDNVARQIFTRRRVQISGKRRYLSKGLPFALRQHDASAARQSSPLLIRQRIPVDDAFRHIKAGSSRNVRKSRLSRCHSGVIVRVSSNARRLFLKRTFTRPVLSRQVRNLFLIRDA
jgi:hypothetical protein